MIKSKKIRSSFFSFIVVLPNNRKTLSLRIPYWIIKTLIASLAGIALVLVFFFLFSVQTSYRLTDYASLKLQSTNQIHQIHRFNSQMNVLKTELKKLADQEETIRILLNESETNRYARDRNLSLFEKKKK